MGSQSFHHVVLFRLRAGVTLDRVRSARDDLAALVETLPGVRDFVVTENIAPDSAGFNLALIAHFEDQRAYEIFARHPEAQRVMATLLRDVASEHVVVQGIG